MGLSACASSAFREPILSQKSLLNIIPAARMLWRGCVKARIVVPDATDYGRFVPAPNDS